MAERDWNPLTMLAYYYLAFATFTDGELDDSEKAMILEKLIDFTGNDKQLGKPAVSDLASGYLTAPVLYALEENESLAVLINRELVEKEDLNNALNIVMNSQAIKRSRKLAEDFAALSKEAILWIPDSEYKRALLALPEFVLSRLY